MITDAFVSRRKEFIQKITPPPTTKTTEPQKMYNVFEETMQKQRRSQDFFDWLLSRVGAGEWACQ